MTHNALPDFQALAEQTGLPLPPLLAQLLASGQTDYGPDWPATWRERSLQGSPAFISWEDFEWQRAEDARTTISDWLNPEDQDGRRFLPFGESGAGDAFCAGFLYGCHESLPLTESIYLAHACARASLLAANAIDGAKTLAELQAFIHENGQAAFS